PNRFPNPRCAQVEMRVAQCRASRIRESVGLFPYECPPFGFFSSRLRAADCSRNQSFRQSAAIVRISIAEMSDRAFDNILAAHLSEAGRDIVDKALFLVLAHQTVKRAGLRKIVVFAMLDRQVGSGNT